MIMDPTVIEEIAEQLGMAADQAGQFVAENLPDFAALKATQCAVPLVAFLSLVVILILVAIVSGVQLAKARAKKRLKYENGRIKDLDDWDSYISFWILVGSLVILGITILFSFLFVPSCITGLIGWQQYPEAMLIDVALKAIG